MLLAITGTPCTGKTTVARLLAKRLGWKLVDLNSLARDKKLYAGYDQARECWIADMAKISKAIGKMRDKDLIIESHFAHDLPADAVIVLRCSPKLLLARMRKRGWKEGKIAENLEAEIMEICLGEAKARHTKVLEIDATGKNPRMVMEEVLQGLKLAGAGKLHLR